MQGLTEFLPVSSSGHLVIFQKILGFKESGIVFEVAVHVGTVLSILTVYFKVLKSYIKELGQGLVRREVNRSIRLSALLIAGSIPTAIMGLSLKDLFEELFHSSFAVGVSLCITGLILFLTKFKREQSDSVKVGAIDLSMAERISFLQAVLMGVAQGCAITPGISRAGSTISAGIISGIERNTAASFSFIMSVPAVLGAALLQLKDLNEFNMDYLILLLIGLISSYITGLLGLLLVLKIVKQGRIELFSYYLWVVGPLTIFFLGG